MSDVSRREFVRRGAGVLAGASLVPLVSCGPPDQRLVPPMFSSEFVRPPDPLGEIARHLNALIDFNKFGPFQHNARILRHADGVCVGSHLFGWSTLCVFQDGPPGSNIASCVVPDPVVEHRLIKNLAKEDLIRIAGHMARQRGLPKVRVIDVGVMWDIPVPTGTG